MAQSAGVGHGIEDVYKSVISDVINQVKDAFLDESVDIDVLQQLKRAWEEKVQESGAVDLEGQRVVPPPNVRQNARQPTTSGLQQAPQPVSTQFILQQQQQQAQQQQQQQQQQVAQGNMQVPQVATSLPTQVSLSGTQPMMMIRPQPGGSGFQPVVQSQPAFILQQNGQLLAQPGTSNIHIVGGNAQGHPQYAIMQGNRMVLVQPNQMPLNLSNQQIISALRQNAQGGNGGGTLPQLDGAVLLEEASVQSKPQKPEKKAAKTVAKGKIPQLDGAPGMSDSSSEEEDEEDEDPLRRLAGLQNEVGDDSEANDEEPLNSDDDQSDEEDLKTLFDSDNVVICQFEKVHRARSKWKFVLKDGIMHLNGNDYCFQKCTGEAEW